MTPEQTLELSRADAHIATRYGLSKRKYGKGRAYPKTARFKLDTITVEQIAKLEAELEAGGIEYRVLDRKDAHIPPE